MSPPYYNLSTSVKGQVGGFKSSVPALVKNVSECWRQIACYRWCDTEEEAWKWTKNYWSDRQSSQKIDGETDRQADRKKDRQTSTSRRRGSNLNGFRKKYIYDHLPRKFCPTLRLKFLTNYKGTNRFSTLWIVLSSPRWGNVGLITFVSWLPFLSSPAEIRSYI